MSIVTDILSYIPQRAPFVMVDTLEQCDESHATSAFTVQPDNIFVRSGNLTEPAVIENIAQTAAAHMGYNCALQGKPVPVGFIGSIENLKVYDFPKVGEVMQSSIQIKNKILNATILEGKVSVNDKEIASCDMKIFISES